MSTPNILVAKYGPLSVDDSLSIPQFMTQYNPDNVAPDKLVHIDTITGKSLTYGELRAEAAKCAWGLRHKLGLKEGDVVSLICPNSVRAIRKYRHSHT
jgi:4-coumarate--CoA ligase